MADPPPIPIPGNAVKTDGTDLGDPTKRLLQTLNLLPTEEATREVDARRALSLQGYPNSIAVIEDGATFAAKGWSGGIGAVVIATWGSVWAWYSHGSPNEKVTALGGAALVIAAGLIAISYLLASDVKGRGLAAAATIEARSRIATALIHAAEEAHAEAAAEDGTLVPLPAPLKAMKLMGGDEDGWLAIAFREASDGAVKYLLVKGEKKLELPSDQVRFAAAAARSG